VGIAGLLSASLLPNRLEAGLLLLRLPKVSFGASAVLPNRLGVAVVVVVVADVAGLSDMLLKNEPNVEDGCVCDGCCCSAGLPKSPKPLVPVDVVVPNVNGLASAADFDSVLLEKSENDDAGRVAVVVVVALLLELVVVEEAPPKVKLGVVVVVDPNEKLGAFVVACDAVVSPNLNVEIDSSGFLAAAVVELVFVSPKLLNAGKLLVVEVSLAGFAGPASVLNVLKKDEVDSDWSGFTSVVLDVLGFGSG